jgi:hypothetical protein
MNATDPGEARPALVLHPQDPPQVPSVAKQVPSTQYAPGQSESVLQLLGPHSRRVQDKYEGQLPHESGWQVPSGSQLSQ